MSPPLTIRVERPAPEALDASGLGWQGRASRLVASAFGWSIDGHAAVARATPAARCNARRAGIVGLTMLAAAIATAVLTSGRTEDHLVAMVLASVGAGFVAAVLAVRTVDDVAPAAKADRTVASVAIDSMRPGGARWADAPRPWLASEVLATVMLRNTATEATVADVRFCWSLFRGGRRRALSDVVRQPVVLPSAATTGIHLPSRRGLPADFEPYPIGRTADRLVVHLHVTYVDAAGNRRTTEASRAWDLLRKSFVPFGCDRTA